MAISSPIVSLVPGATEIVCALGCEHRLVGVSHQCDFPPSVSRLPKLTRSRIDSRQSPAQIDRQVKELLQSKQSLYEIDLEKLSELQPEIVLTQVVCEVCAISPKDVQVALRSDPRLASASIAGLSAMNFQGFLDDVRAIAKALQVEEQGETLLNQWQSRIAAVRKRVAEMATVTPESTGQPRVIIVEWTEPLMIAAHWSAEFIEIAGGIPLLVKGGEPSRSWSWEEVLASDPDIVIFAPCGMNLATSLELAKEFEDRFRCKNRRGISGERPPRRLYAIDGDALLNRAGPRLIDTIETIARILYPDPSTPSNHDDAWSVVQ